PLRTKAFRSRYPRRDPRRTRCEYEKYRAGQAGSSPGIGRGLHEGQTRRHAPIAAGNLPADRKAAHQGAAGLSFRRAALSPGDTLSWCSRFPGDYGADFGQVRRPAPRPRTRSLLGRLRALTVEIYVQPVGRRCEMLDATPRCIRDTPEAGVSRADRKSPLTLQRVGWTQSSSQINRLKES